MNDGAWFKPNCFPTKGGLVQSVSDLSVEGAKVLIAGAGGLGCHLLKFLAWSGFIELTVVDMDTIELSNLNRQLLFRESDVGKAKAEVAAHRINKMMNKNVVSFKVCRLETLPLNFYAQFNCIIGGLDNLEARRFLNKVVCSLVVYNEKGNLQPETITPLLDGGTTGLQGSVRTVFPGVTPCLECVQMAFTKEEALPVCTIAHRPRQAAHCVQYAMLISWPEEKSDEEFDVENEEHLEWMYHKALLRAQQFEIEGVTLESTKSTIKRTVPAVSSTNQVIAAVLTGECYRILTGYLPLYSTWFLYNGEGPYDSSGDNQIRNPNCAICGHQSSLSSTQGDLSCEISPDKRFIDFIEEDLLKILGREKNEPLADLRVILEDGEYLVASQPNSMEDARSLPLLFSPIADRTIGEFSEKFDEKSKSSFTIIIYSNSLPEKQKLKISLKA